MFPRRLYTRLQRRLAAILTARGLVDTAASEVSDLEQLLAQARSRLEAARVDLAAAEQAWDSELSSIADEQPHLSDRLPLSTSEPGFNPSQVQLRVA